MAMVEEGLEASRKGELIDHEDVGRMIDSWIEERAGGKSGERSIQSQAGLEKA
jgi:predicted transcriptional regulator